MPRLQAISKLPNDIWTSLSSANDIVNEYTKVPIIAEQQPWIILNKNIIGINILNDVINISLQN